MGQSETDTCQNIKNGILRHELSSWKDFCRFVENEKVWPTLIYRGQTNAEWKVESTLDRLEKKYPTKPNLSGGIPKEFLCTRVSRELQLNRFKELSRGKLGLYIPTDDDEWWAIAQHHGLATPLLDWTYSPFVALFFAFEDEKCLNNGNLISPEKRAVFAVTHHLLTEKSSPDTGKIRKICEPLSPKGQGNYRLFNQGGVFIKMPVGKDIETYISENFPKDTYKEPWWETGTGTPHPRAVLQKFIIPNVEREQCLRFLDYMNINRAALFPDLDGASQYINNLWEINFDKATGYINAEET
ncbi:MAG: FRG domain-containing protein [Sedimentisphaerales bacterium]